MSTPETDKATHPISSCHNTVRFLCFSYRLTPVQLSIDQMHHNQWLLAQQRRQVQERATGVRRGIRF